MHEWPLFVFTLALQLAIGAVSIYTLVKYIMFRNQPLVNEKLFFSVLSGISFIGLIASFTHLGTPTNALNTLNNFANSWMSKEIVFTSAFIGLLVVTTILLYLNQNQLVFISLIVTSLIGLFDVYCMAKIYAVSLVSGWNSIHTFTSFYSTTIILGTAFVFVFSLQMLKSGESNLNVTLLISLIIGFAIGLLGLFFMPSSLVETTIIQSTPALIKYEALTTLLTIRWISGFIGLVAILYVTMKKKINLASLIVAVTLLVVAESLGRYIFYYFGA